MMEKTNWPGRKCDVCLYLTDTRGTEVIAHAAGLSGASSVPKLQATAAPEIKMHLELAKN